MRGEPQVKGTGVSQGDPLKLVRDPNTGQVLMKAGGGVWTLPGSSDEIRVRQKRLWLYREGKPICQLATPGVGGSSGGTSLPDGEESGQPLVWNGVGWGPGEKMVLPMAAVGHLVCNELGLGEVSLTDSGVMLPGNRLVPWGAIEKLLKIDVDAPHGLPLKEFEGVLHCEIPIEAPNMREFAWREEVEKLTARVARLVPEITAPPGGSVAFDVTPDGELAVTVKKSGRRFRGTVKLEEI